ncbi:MAG: reverse transcriptase domain-containing protein [Candidatus Thiodiazotropha endolucinida]|nr:hypothetical protein [Candidatus Thiodiazotropha taylori]MCW4346755.1 reverse transcriptase domain-containing protein [Candidatus Thiodiazotropha endolucinida]
MKLGILNPIFKNKGSNNNSTNYRGITITPVLTRLLETILKSRIESTLAEHQNPLQRGFTKNSSPMNCALLVEEFYRNNADLNKPTYIAFMDVKSAFDVVVHPNLMRKLYNQGIGGTNWLLINSLHQESMTAVKWQRQLSPTYVNQQGVRQGGILSADLFKVYDNGLLDRIHNSEKGATIGGIRIQAPTCADDMTLLANDANSLQYLINICKDASMMDGYILQEIKSVILKKDSVKTYPEGETWKIGEKDMPVVDSTTHMGILRSSTNQEMKSVESNIQKARRTMFSLMGTGLHGENGLDPETAVSLLQTYVFPVLYYGLEIILPTGKAMNVLETQQKKIMKQVLSLSTTVADPAVYMLSGTLPAEAMIHKRTMSLFGNITRLSKSSIERQLAERQLEIKTFRSKSWFIAVKKILLKYDLPNPEELLNNPTKKLIWKKRYNTAINKYWTDQIVSQSELYSSLKYLSKSYIIGRCHPAVKPYARSNRDINRIPLKNKVITGTYLLQTNRAKFNQNEVNPTCPLCNNGDETLQHFLIDCKTLDDTRKPILDDFLCVLNELLIESPSASKETLLQLLIDSNSVFHDCNVKRTDSTSALVDTLHYHSRRLVYSLNITRYKRLELVPKRNRKRKGTATHT